MPKLTLLVCILTTLLAIAEESQTRSDYIIPFWDKYLRALQEPPLPADLQPGSSLFRLTFNQSWQPPIIVRIETFDIGRPARATWMTARQTIQTNGSTPYTFGPTYSREVTDSDLAAFRAAFQAVKLCGAALEGKTGGLDGFSYDFEFANATRYCAASRWSPNAGDPFRESADSTLTLAAAD